MLRDFAWLSIASFLLCGCQESPGVSTADDERYAREYEAQMAESAAQLQVTAAQLERQAALLAAAEENARRQTALLELQEAQAERFNRILERWEAIGPP